MRKILRPQQKLSEDGFTLIEGLITLGIVGFIMAIITVLLYIGTTAWTKQTTRIRMETQGQNFIQILTYDLRQAVPGTVKITNTAGEMNNSMITFTMNGKSSPVSFYMKTMTSSTGQKSRQIIYSEPYGNTITPSYSTQVLAQNVVSVYYTYPKISDTSRIMVNLSVELTPLKNKPPVMYQTQETIYVRN